MRQAASDKTSSSLKTLHLPGPTLLRRNPFLETSLEKELIVDWATSKISLKD
jgi:hypothetical protein